MSVKVDLDKLSDTLADFPFGYLITVGDDFRAHTVAVVPVFQNGVFTIGPLGNTTARNAAAHAAVTVLWPPREPTGYSLIVDGTAEVTDDGLRLTPSRAVLHRSPDGVHDCVSLKG
ncbi:pyridoxamine 5'-phosphate oxidase family protein [Mycobacterium sp. NPDC003323]